MEEKFTEKVFEDILNYELLGKPYTVGVQGVFLKIFYKHYTKKNLCLQVSKQSEGHYVAFTYLGRFIFSIDFKLTKKENHMVYSKFKVSIGLGKPTEEGYDHSLESCIENIEEILEKNRQKKIDELKKYILLIKELIIKANFEDSYDFCNFIRKVADEYSPQSIYEAAMLKSEKQLDNYIKGLVSMKNL